MTHTQVHDPDSPVVNLADFRTPGPAPLPFPFPGEPLTTEQRVDTFEQRYCGSDRRRAVIIGIDMLHRHEPA